jgi:gliding motility-associated-like protein
MQSRIHIVLSLLLWTMLNGLHGQTLPVTCQGNVERYSVSGLPGSVFEWNVTGGTIVSNYSDSVDIHWDGLSGNNSITVIEHTENGCAGTPVVSQVLVGKASINLGPDQVTCLGKSIGLDAPAGFNNYVWSDGSTGMSVIATSSGIVWLEVTDDVGCKARDTVQLNFEALSLVNLGPDTTLCGDESLVLTVPEGDVLWTIHYNGQETTGTQPILVVYPGSQEIIVEVTSALGCIGTDTLNIAECTRQELLGKIPNAITPDGDGINDTWKIEKIMDYPNASIKIFDRWGRLVYQVQGGYDNLWNGTDRNGNALPVDSYYYIIDLGNGKDGITGFITIIR